MSASAFEEFLFFFFFFFFFLLVFFFFFFISRFLFACYNSDIIYIYIIFVCLFFCRGLINRPSKSIQGSHSCWTGAQQSAGSQSLLFFFFFFFLSAFIFRGVGSSKLTAIKWRNHLETQTSAYTLVAYGERATAQTFKVTVYLHSQREGQGKGQRMRTGGRQGC